MRNRSRERDASGTREHCYVRTGKEGRETIYGEKPIGITLWWKASGRELQKKALKRHQRNTLKSDAFPYSPSFMIAFQILSSIPY